MNLIFSVLSWMRDSVAHAAPNNCRKKKRPPRGSVRSLGLPWVTDLTANIKLLGAAIWSPDWSFTPLRERVTQAKELLLAVGGCPDSQGTLCLLRICACWAKILYSCRTVPSVLPLSWLLTLTSGIEPSGRVPLSNDGWRLASLGISAGGIGARSACETPSGLHGKLFRCHRPGSAHMERLRRG